MDRGQNSFDPPEKKAMNLKQLAAIQFINQIKDENRNYYYKAEDLIEDAEKAEVII